MPSYNIATVLGRKPLIIILILAVFILEALKSSRRIYLLLFIC